VKRPSTRKSRPHAALSALITAIAVTVPLVLVTAQGCGLQGEGQRCSRETATTHDGSEDCAAGLICTPVLGAQSDICCPSGASDNLNCQAQNDGAGGGMSTSTGTATTSSSTGTGTSTGTGAGGGGGTSTGTSTSTGTGAGGAGGGP
jgi:hypothetical protein